MSAPAIGNLETFTALERPDLLAAPVSAALREWSRGPEAIAVAIEEDLADTAVLIERYDLDPRCSVNCVIVSGKRSGAERVAACLVPADKRLDVNNVVRKLIDARKASFHPHDRAVAESGMEYGGITPVGLPRPWRILVDAAAAEVDWALLGSGLRRSKLFLPGDSLAELPNADVVVDLAR